jgi:hypothetical protein
MLRAAGYFGLRKEAADRSNFTPIAGGYPQAGAAIRDLSREGRQIDTAM